MKNDHEWENKNIRKETLEAEKRIRPYIRETPSEYSPYLSKLGNCKVFLKLENLQLTGSFKLRGATNKILSLSTKEKEMGVITASSGNHGMAFSYLIKRFHLNGTIYLPENASQAKIEALRLYEAKLKFHGKDYYETESFSKHEAKRNGKTFISPYNDIKIIGGQATIGIELEKQIGDIDAIFVPIGGGGLVSGIAGYLKSVDRNIEIIGCQPKNSPVMYESIKAGHIIEMESKPTLSDGTAGGIEKESLTFDICKKYVDDYILISEEEIKDAIMLLLQRQYLLAEGSAALSVASFIKIKDRFKNKNVVLIISGAKISFDKLKEIICN